MARDNLSDTLAVQAFAPAHPRAFQSLVEVLDVRATDSPRRDAYLFVTNATQVVHRLTYGELAEQARQLASRLRSVADAGDRVLLVYDSGPAFVLLFFACQAADLVPVPMNPPRSASAWERATAIVIDCGATLAFTDDTLLDPILSHTLCSEPLRLLRWSSIESLIRNSSPSDCYLAQPSPSSLAFLQYTSGSTAQPRGVRVAHASLLSNLAAIEAEFRTTPLSVGVTWLPVFHDMGLIGGLLQPLYVGYPSIVLPQFEFMMQPLRWLRAIGHFKASISGGPNFAYAHCVDKIQDSEMTTLDLRSWQVAFSGAELVQPQTLEQFAGKFAPAGFRYESFLPCYGLAESTLLVTASHSNRGPSIETFSAKAIRAGRATAASAEMPDTIRITSCGRPSREHEVTIVDPETHSRVAEAEIGEIWTRGASITDGYWNRSANEGVFDGKISGDPTGATYLRTGDLGFSHDNRLFITGRRKDLIKIRGQNYFPDDIEFVATQAHPAVRPGTAVATSVRVGNQEQCVVLAELDRQWLVTGSGGDRLRVVARPFNCEQEGHLHAAPIASGRVPVLVTGLPPFLSKFNRLCIRPLAQTSSTDDHRAVQIVSWTGNQCLVVSDSATDCSPTGDLFQLSASSGTGHSTVDPLSAIANAIRQRVLTHSRLSLSGVVFLLPGHLLRTSSGKLRRTACRNALLDGALGVVVDMEAFKGIHATQSLNDSENP